MLVVGGVGCTFRGGTLSSSVNIARLLLVEAEEGAGVEGEGAVELGEDHRESCELSYGVVGSSGG